MRRRTIAVTAALLTAGAIVAVGVVAAIGLDSSKDSFDPSNVSSHRVEPAKELGIAMSATQPPDTAGQSEEPGQAADNGKNSLDDLLSLRVDVDVDFNEFRQLLPKDAILPIYEPQFVPGDLTSLDPSELVMGVEINGESKAYPVGHLNYREMVNDVVGGVPILVTW